MSSPALAHSYGFDPTYGMSLPQLLAIEPPHPPADFVEFWQQRYQAVIGLDAQPKLSHSYQVRGHHRVHILTYRSTQGVKIGGWLLIPLRTKPVRGVLIGHGYGGRDAPDAPETLAGLDDAVILFPCFRGMGLSPVAGLSAQPTQHVLHGIEDRDHYVHGGCVDDLWLGVSALLQLFPRLAGRILVMGISFAGGISALAAPWDERINRLCIQWPSFGHHALRLKLPCIGSGEAVRRYQNQHHFNVLQTLVYYDAATAARFLAICTLVVAAQFDPVVPPPGQFAIYNAIAPSSQRLYVQLAGHFDYPNQQADECALRPVVRDFITCPDADPEMIL